MAVREIDKQGTPADQKLVKIKSRYLDMQKASKSIQKLADHLRNFSRGVAEKQETVDIYDAIADSLFIASNKIMSARVQTSHNISKGSCFTTGCPNQLEQIFINLVGNACDAMADREERKLTINIEPCLFNEEAAWRCDITDTGTGIPPEIMDEIFQSFFTTKEKGKGTGLGLSISRGIAKNHKGDIQVTSKVGKGTTFSVFLPRTAA
jgi:C4-dicarboxylate-specific signal transduction histidine kinase